MTLIFLYFQQAVGQFLRLELYRFAREAMPHPDAGQCCNIKQQQAHWQIGGQAVDQQAAQRRAGTQQECEPACVFSGGWPLDDGLEAGVHSGWSQWMFAAGSAVMLVDGALSENATV